MIGFTSKNTPNMITQIQCSDQGVRVILVQMSVHPVTVLCKL